MSIIKLENVRKEFPGGIVALDDVSLEIYEKEFFVLVGPLNAGKSTLLRLIAGLEEPTAGRIYINNQVINHIPPTERDVALIFQNLTLYPNMNVYKNIEFGLKFKGLTDTEIKERVENIAKILDIDNILEKNPSELDCFEKQRVVFARAAVKYPKVLLIDQFNDEYTSNDIKKKLYEEIKTLHQELQITIILAIDSNNAHLNQIGDRNAIMNKGKIQQIGSYQELLCHPQNKFVIEFMSQGPVNFINAIVCENQEGIYLSKGQLNILIKPEKAQKLKQNKYIGKEVIMVIKPEDIYISHDNDSFSFEATLESIDELKGQPLFNLSNNGIHFFMNVLERRGYKKGDILKVSINTDKIFLLDKITEEVI